MSCLVEALARAAFEQHYLKSLQRELLSDYAASRSGADNHDVNWGESQCVWPSITSSIASIFQLAAARLPPYWGLP